MRANILRVTVALVGLLLLMPAANAQTDDFSIDAGSVDDFISPTNSTDVDVTVEAACALILQEAGSSDVTVSVDGEGYVTADDATVELDATECVGSTSGIISGDGTVTLEPVDDTLGLKAFNITFSASLGESSDTDEVQGVQLDYLPGHDMDPAGDQTFDVTNGTITFPLEVEITANAKSMVMFERISASAGSVSGFSSMVFDVPNDVREETFQVKWTAPSGDWDEETVTFYTYSHCLDDTNTLPCDEHQPADVTWTFVNAGGSSGDNTTGGDDKDSPGLPLVGAVVAIGLVALARRRS